MDSLGWINDTQLNVLRMSIFVGVLCLMLSAEALLPRKQRTQARKQRWSTNLGLVFINTFAMKILGPLTAVGTAAYALDHGWGLLSRLPFPLYIDIILGVVLLDLAIYIQHVCSHKFPILWRFHKVHHCDRDIDVTTGIRFHPIEILASTLYKCIIILILGPLTLSVVIFEIVLNASAMFNHANVKLPKFIDNIIRLLFVTPDMHRVHHSIHMHETNSNYGFCLSLWDKIFRTYIKQPKDGHHAMTIGLEEHQTKEPSSLLWSLKLPFYNKIISK